MSEIGNQRIVVHVYPSENRFDVIRERRGEQPKTLYASVDSQGKEVSLPYKNMKKLIKSITGLYRDMRGKNLKDVDVMKNILRSAFQLYRIGNVSHPLLKPIYGRIPAPGIFDQTWESWDKLDNNSKKDILSELDAYYKDVDEHFARIHSVGIKSTRSPDTTQPHSLQTTPPLASSNIQPENLQLLLKAIKLASVGAISATVLKKLVDLYRAKSRTTERRVKTVDRKQSQIKHKLIKKSKKSKKTKRKL